MAPEQEQEENQDLENKNTDTTPGGGAKDDSDDVSGVDSVAGGAAEDTLEFDITEEGADDKGKKEGKDGKKPADDKGAEGDDDGNKGADPKAKKQGRIRELNRKNRELERENERLRGTTGQQAQQLTAVHKQNIEQFELRATSAADQAKKDLETAVENGDVKAQVEATARLSEANSYLVRIREHKVEMGYANPDKKAGGERQDQHDRRPSREEAHDDEPLPNPTKDKWVAGNPWFDENSDDYDEDMASEAQSYATRLERKLQTQGQSELIGSRSYFNNIDKYMKENFPERFDDGSPNRTPPMKGARDGVTRPVRDNVPGGGNGGGQKGKVVITRAEYDIAMSLGNTSAGMNKDGTRKNEKELVQMYLKQKDSPNEKNNRAIEQQGFKERGIRV